VASATALSKVEKIADSVVACVAGFGPEFYVSDFYRYWHEPSADEVLQCFKEWGLRRRPNLEALGKGIVKRLDISRLRQE
jgi:predicted phosphoribosyltransferase